MNKVILGLTCFCWIIFSAGLHASTVNSIEFRSAAFLHQSKKFRHLYDKVNADFQVESTMALDESFEIWAEIDYMKKSKSKKNYHTKVQLANCSLGVQYIYPFLPHLDGYLGTGLSMLRLDLHNRSFCEKEKKSRLIVGSLTKIGVRYWFVEQFFLDFFVDYLYQKHHFKKRVYLGGFKPGLGIGVCF